MPQLTSALRTEYQQLFDRCQITATRRASVDAEVDRILKSRSRYQAVGTSIGVPWPVIGVLHSLEASLDFRRHIHNGDPLTARTVHVPKGRPSLGDPPFSWEDSARDALALQGCDTWADWSVPGILFRWESYNGWGYRRFHPEVKSPYLWAGTNHYKRGKYVADGTWSASAVSRQIGAAALLRRLAECGEVATFATGFAASVKAVKPSTAATPPEQPAGTAGNDAWPEVTSKTAGLFRFRPRVIQAGALELQRFLNHFPGIFLREDGLLGPRSSAACRQLFGHYLAGDPREAAA